MGTKVQYKSSMPGHYSMGNLENESSSHSWRLFYGERGLANAQYHNVFLPRATPNGYLSDEKDVVKQKILEHEAIFKNQVYELHRLYRIQRDLMDKIKSTRLCRNQLPIDTLFSSGPLASHVTSKDASRWNLPSFPVANSSTSRLSISGIEESRSSSSFVKGHDQKPRLFPPQVGGNAKEAQVLESRPTKLRRKMLDLQLPADEYIDSDEGEEFHDENVPKKLIYNHIENQTAELEGDIKLYADDGEKAGGLQDGSKYGSCLANRSCLADLNEPIRLVETNSSTYMDPPVSGSCNAEIKCPNLSSGPEVELIHLHRKIYLNTNNVSDDVTGNGTHLDGNISKGGNLPYFLEPGSSNSYKQVFSQVLQTKNWPVTHQPKQHFRDEICEPSCFHSIDKGHSKEGTVFGLQFTKRSPEINSEQPGSSIPSAPDFRKTWSSSNSSWDCAKTNFQKSTCAQTQHLIPAASSPENFQLSFCGVQSLGEREHLSDDFRPNKGFDGKIPYCNETFLGSSSEYKEDPSYPSIHFNYTGQCNDNNQILKDLSQSASLKLFKDAISTDVSPKKCVVPGNRLSNEAERKIEENRALLPWLRSTPAGNNKTTNSGRFSSAEELEPSPISGTMHEFKIENSSLHLPLVRLSDIEENRKNTVVDINLPCDPFVADSDNRVAVDNIGANERGETKVSTFGHLIDLNLCLSDNEEVSMRSTPKTSVKMCRDIDLEAPAAAEAEEINPAEEIVTEMVNDSVSKPQCEAIGERDEFMALAAEAILSISSSVSHSCLENATCNAVQDSLDNPLNWLVEMAFLCENESENKSLEALRGEQSVNREECSCSPKGTDLFESMTLRLAETKEEEYMPKPLVPENIIQEEKTTTLLQNRPRKGQGRRGRQRKDFQRDILPGIASLSRLEVTEDLNTFGELMRASGHLWSSGLAKRNSSKNGCGRGRRRTVISPSTNQAVVNLPLMHKLKSTEMGIEDRSLSGWGKKTRRPRRQRVPVPAGNLAVIPFA